jgi:hypothetical protein
MVRCLALIVPKNVNSQSYLAKPQHKYKDS